MISILAATASVAAVAAQDKPAPVVLSQADQALIARAEARGRLMYAYDQAAWHGTDDLRAKLPDFASKVGGWIVDGPAGAAQLVFFSRDSANPTAIYVANFRDNRLVDSKLLRAGDDARLSPARRKLIEVRRKALEAAAAGRIAMCSNQSPNTIVLPPERPGGPHLVYIMTPQTKTGSLPFGGHYLYEVADDGTIAASRAFTKSCLELPVKPPAQMRGKDGFIGIAHLLDPTPTEIHVFSQFALKTRLGVMIETSPQRLFAVDNGKITALPTARR